MGQPFAPVVSSRANSLTTHRRRRQDIVRTGVRIRPRTLLSSVLKTTLNILVYILRYKCMALCIVHNIRQSTDISRAGASERMCVGGWVGVLCVLSWQASSLPSMTGLHSACTLSLGNFQQNDQDVHFVLATALVMTNNDHGGRGGVGGCVWSCCVEYYLSCHYASLWM